MPRKILQNIKSDVSGKIPSSDILYPGEIAVNYSAGSEKLFIKNSSGQVVSFIGEKEIDKRIAASGGGGGGGEIPSDIMKIIEDNELVNAESQTQLDARINNLYALNEVENGFTKVTSLVNIPIDKRLVIADISTNEAISLKGSIPSGKDIHIIIKNVGTSNIELALPSSGNFILLSDDIISFNTNEIHEVNIISNGTNYFIRGV